MNFPNEHTSKGYFFGKAKVMQNVFNGKNLKKIIYQQLALFIKRTKKAPGFCLEFKKNPRHGRDE